MRCDNDDDNDESCITFAKTMAHASRVDYPSSTGAQVTDTGNLSVANGYKGSISKKNWLAYCAIRSLTCSVVGGFQVRSKQKKGTVG